MERRKWMGFFCLKYLLWVLLVCAIPSFLVSLIFLIVSLIYKSQIDSLTFLPLCVGGVAFIFCSLFNILFIFNVKREERLFGYAFIPYNVEKVKRTLYFSDNWIIIPGRTAICTANLIKIETGLTFSRGYRFFCVAFYTRSRKKPIVYSIYLGYNVKKETAILTYRVNCFAERINCPHTPNSRIKI